MLSLDIELTGITVKLYRVFHIQEADFSICSCSVLCKNECGMLSIDIELTGITLKLYKVR